MKTPREILFGRHKAAEPKLDQIRREALAQMGEKVSRVESRERESTPILFKLWLELILPAKRIWTGLAAVWVAILVLNFSASDDSSPQLASKSAAPDRQTIAELKEQKLLMAQLLGLNDASADADKPKSIAPRPRSEKRFEQMIG